MPKHFFHYLALTLWIFCVGVSFASSFPDPHLNPIESSLFSTKNNDSLVISRNNGILNTVWFEQDSLTKVWKSGSKTDTSKQTSLVYKKLPSKTGWDTTLTQMCTGKLCRTLTREYRVDSLIQICQYYNSTNSIESTDSIVYDHSDLPLRLVHTIASGQKTYQREWQWRDSLMYSMSYSEAPNWQTIEVVSNTYDKGNLSKTEVFGIIQSTLYTKETVIINRIGEQITGWKRYEGKVDSTLLRDSCFVISSANSTVTKCIELPSHDSTSFKFAIAPLSIKTNLAALLPFEIAYRQNLIWLSTPATGNVSFTLYHPNGKVLYRSQLTGPGKFSVMLPNQLSGPMAIGVLQQGKSHATRLIPLSR